MVHCSLAPKLPYSGRAWSFVERWIRSPHSPELQAKPHPPARVHSASSAHAEVLWLAVAYDQQAPEKCRPGLRGMLPSALVMFLAPAWTEVREGYEAE